MLLVDDEESIAFAMKRYFEIKGFRVDWARELEEAEALLANGKYEVVICDLRLTGVHGAEGLDILSYIGEHCPSTRTVMLTAYGSGEVEAEAKNRGVDLFYRKPRPLPDLAQGIFGLLGGCP